MVTPVFCVLFIGVKVSGSILKCLRQDLQGRWALGGWGNMLLQVLFSLVVMELPRWSPTKVFATLPGQVTNDPELESLASGWKGEWNVYSMTAVSSNIHLNWKLLSQGKLSPARSSAEHRWPFNEAKSGVSAIIEGNIKTFASTFLYFTRIWGSG